MWSKTKERKKYLCSIKDMECATEAETGSCGFLFKQEVFRITGCNPAEIQPHQAGEHTLHKAVYKSHLFANAFKCKCYSFFSGVVLPLQ